MASSTWLRRSLVLWSCIGVAALMVAGLLLGAVQKMRAAARRVECYGHLTAIHLAMRNYHDKYGCFPPAQIRDKTGRPMHSWRVLLGEFLYADLYTRYKMSEPWDGPNNRKLADRMPGCYSCASDPEAAANGWTNYVVVVGEGNIFTGDKSASLQDVTDPANTILVVETAGTHIAWLEPKDLSFDHGPLAVNDWSRPTIASHDDGGAGMCFVDGTKLRWRRLPGNARTMFLVRPRTPAEPRPE